MASSFTLEPLPFPPAEYYSASLRTVKVDLMNNHSIQRKVLLSSSGTIYELGGKLRKALYGEVRHGVLIDHVDGQYVRTTKQVAIKIYSIRLIESMADGNQENPLNEISAMQFIGNKNSNLMGQIEVCKDSDYIYLIMDYINGGELFDYVTSQGKFSEDKARNMFVQLINALTELQRLGVGHRDLSLENILVDEDDRFVVIDFGMSLRLHKDEKKSQFLNIARQPVCGKRNYVSPEVLRGDDSFNPMLSDIWAAGIILFMVITGVPPVDIANNSDERFKMISDNRLKDLLESWNMKMSDDALDLIQKLLKPNPSNRLTIAEIRQHPWMTVKSKKQRLE